MSGTPNKQENARARVGSVLKDKWRLDSLLGVGGTAAVYAGSHRNGKRAAIKILHRELSENGDLVGRFLREGYVANKLEHPGAVSVLDDDRTDDGSVFLVMELLDGYSLDRHTRTNAERLSIKQVLAIGDEVLDVLANAHARGVIHRDIKPANLFLCSNGKVKVLDFGIARLREGNNDVSATQTGTTIGTPAFMPPEQARGRWQSVDPRTDIWSVGATLFALFTGHRPRRAETVNEELLLAMTAPVVKIQTVARDVPFPVARVVDRALEFEMNDRFPDARTMQLALRAAASELGFAGPTSQFSSTIGQFNTVQPDTAPVVHGVDARSQLAQSMFAAQTSPTPMPAPQPPISSFAQTSSAPSGAAHAAMASTQGGPPPTDLSPHAMTAPMPISTAYDPVSGEFLDPRLTTSRPILSPSVPPAFASKSQSGGKGAVIALAVLGVLVCAGGLTFYKVRASGARDLGSTSTSMHAPESGNVTTTPIPVTTAGAATPSDPSGAIDAPTASSNGDATSASATPSASSSAAAIASAKRNANGKNAPRSTSSAATAPNVTPPATPNATAARPAASAGNPWDQRF